MGHNIFGDAPKASQMNLSSMSLSADVSSIN